MERHLHQCGIGPGGFQHQRQANCNDTTGESQRVFAIGPVGSGGGPSNCTTSSGGPQYLLGRYAKPSWQTGTGVPSDGKRDIPDMSLFAGTDSPALLCGLRGGPAKRGTCNLTANGYSDFRWISAELRFRSGVRRHRRADRSEAQDERREISITVLYPLAATNSHGRVAIRTIP